MRIFLSLLLTTGWLSAQPFTQSDPAFMSSLSSLRVGLVGAWRLEEDNGMISPGTPNNNSTRYDHSRFGNHLSSSGVGRAAGISGNAAVFNRQYTNYLWTASSSSLQMGDIDYTISAWVKLTTKVAGENYWIVSKDNTSPAGSRDYSLLLSQATDRFAFIVFRATDSAVTLTATNGGSPSVGVWYHILATHNAAADTMSIRVNGGTTDTKATGGALQSAGTAAFQLGAPAFFATNNFMNGVVDEVYLWKRTLTAAEQTQVYQAGLAATFPMFRPYSQSPYGTNWVIGPGWSGAVVATNGEVLAGHVSWQTAGIASGYNRLFNAFYGLDANEYVVEKNLTNGTWGSPVLMGSAHAGGAGDSDHNYTSLGFDSLGYVHAFYGCHVSPLYYRRSVATNSTASWSSEANLASVASYPAVVVDQSDKLYVFFRNGTRYIDLITSTNHGTNWSTSTHLVDSGNDTTIWSYHGNIELGRETPQNSIHMMWTWRNNFGPNDPTQFTNIYYMKTLDGGSTWVKADGSAYTLPVVIATAEVAYSGGSCLPANIALDTNGLPRLCFNVANGTAYWTNSLVKLSSWNGSAWQTQTLPGTNYYYIPQLYIGSDNAYRMFSSKPAGQTMQVFEVASTDGGSSWSSTQLSDWRYNLPKIVVTPRTPFQTVLGVSWSDDAGNILYIERALP